MRHHSCNYLKMTCSTAPDSPPANVTATTTSATSILVAWAMVSWMEQNGAIVMYEVMTISLEDSGVAIVMKTVNVSESVQFVDVMELEEYVSYNISVRAYTSVGAGPYSVVETVRTLQDRKFGL